MVAAAVRAWVVGGAGSGTTGDAVVAEAVFCGGVATDGGVGSGGVGSAIDTCAPVVSSTLLTTVGAVALCPAPENASTPAA